MTFRTYEVGIVGGGAAGLSAALVLATARRRVVVSMQAARAMRSLRTSMSRPWKASGKREVENSETARDARPLLAMASSIRCQSIENLSHPRDSRQRLFATTSTKR